ncbi:MAG TPA: glutathione S-transferase family protein [Telluria sp.]|nr:glutathione S-transferase family protein [Telluria sp.]
MSNTKPAAPIVVTTFKQVPAAFIGFVRDLRVRWALEEAGRAYEVRAVGPDDVASPDYRQQQPFGQIPVYQEGDVTLFESGAILWHIAQSSPALLPASEEQRRQALTWMFASLNSVEQHVGALAQGDFFNRDDAWYAERRPALVDMASKRLSDLENWMRDRPFLAGEFSAADILMTTVLRLLGRTDMVSSRPVLRDYVARTTSRPAFVKALQDHTAHFQAALPA